MRAVRISGLGIADLAGEFVTRSIDVATLTWAGLEGDRHAGVTMKAGVRQPWFPKGAEVRNTRQLSLVSEEECAQIAATLELNRIDFRWLGANVLVSGAPTFTRTAPGSRIFFPSGACLVIDGENEPCRKAGKAVAEGAGAASAIASRFVKAAWNLRGVVAWVERPGVMRVGDDVRLQSR